MGTIEEFREKERSTTLFDLKEGEGVLNKFVQVGTANRINTPAQSTWLFNSRTFFAYMGWPWGSAMCDLVEDLQTTCTEPHGAREMLLEAVQFDRYAEHNRNKSLVNIGGQSK